MDTIKRYVIHNTATGEIKAMNKAFIVQELERPTSSSVLPLPAKGEYGDPFSVRLSDEPCNAVSIAGRSNALQYSSV